MNLYLYQNSLKSFLQIQGEDALDYLQSQLTIDLRSLENNQVRYGFSLSQKKKSKVRAGFYILKKSDEDFILLSRGTPAKEAIALIEENIVADEVEIFDETNSYRLVTVHGPDTPAVFSDLGLPIPENNFISQTSDSFAFLDQRMAFKTYCIVYKSHLDIPSFELCMSNHEKSIQELEKMRLQSLLVKIPEEIGIDDLPQEGNLDKECVDFEKGCYLGQEVMARLDAMGKVRRKIELVYFEQDLSSQLPLPLLVENKQVGVLKSSIKNNHDFFGIALLHENALPMLCQGKVNINESESFIRQYEG